jgi:hypothetical protein
MRIVLATIIGAFATFHFATASAHAQLNAVEFRWACAPHAPECEGIEAIGDTVPQWVEKLPFFATKSAAGWAECQRFGDPLLCITLGSGDMARLNSFATPEHRHNAAVLVYKGKAVAVMGFIAPSGGPLYLGGSGGAMSTADVKAFFESSE